MATVAAPMAYRRRIRVTPRSTVLYTLLVLLALLFLFPFYIMVRNAFLTDLDITSPTFVWLPIPPHLENISELFSNPDVPILTGLRNSAIVAVTQTVFQMLFASMAGYGLARSKFRGKDHVAFWIISTRMAPIAAVILPLFVIFRFTGLLGSTWGLIVAYLTFNLPFAIWIMNAFFAGLPPSLEEAAMVDGASRWTAFRRIALPLVLPGIATTTVLCLVFSWNDYAFASTFSGPDSQTLPIAASQLVTQTEIDWGQLTAIGTIVVAPMIVVGLVVRRWLVTGLTLGAVTGE